MKSLKITLALAVFCLTISGTNKSEDTINKEEILKIDKTEHQMVGPAKTKKDKPING
ncbi:hypothetical protein [Pontimicrobium sp. IMCC45349]|uniref:hypothetical protein n=1 Tax=Pontimicrobium sp. IMCC45349 TaxID=3391574 RepID=UPI0039A35916